MLVFCGYDAIPDAVFFNREGKLQLSYREVLEHEKPRRFYLKTSMEKDQGQFFALDRRDFSYWGFDGSKWKILDTREDGVIPYFVWGALYVMGMCCETVTPNAISELDLPEHGAIPLPDGNAILRLIELQTEIAVREENDRLRNQRMRDERRKKREAREATT